MAKTGRLEVRVEPGLLVRLDERCEVLGQTRTKFIERALESALRVPSLDSLGPSPSPALVKAASEESMRQGFVEGALERVEKSRPKVPASDPDRRRPLALKSIPGVQSAAELMAAKQDRANAERLRKAKGS